MDSRDNAKILNESQAEGFADEKAEKCAFKTPQDFKMFDKKAQRLNKSQAEGFLMKKRGCAAFCAEISLEWLSHKQKANSPLFRKKPTPH